MLVLLLIFTSVFLTIFYIYFLRKRNFWKNKNVPHVKPTPILGNYSEYIFLKKYIGHVAQDICQAFPNEPYVGAFYGSEPALIVKDPEFIKLVMTKDFYYFSSREVSKYTHNEVMTQNLFFTFGDRWRVIRQNMTPIFSSAKMRNMFYLIEKCCYAFEDLIDHEVSNSSVIETRGLTSRFTMDCISACAFGIDSKTMEKGSMNNPFYIIAHKILNSTTMMAIRWIARGMWPALFYGLGFKTFSSDGEVFFKNVLLDVFKGREYKPSTRNDFIDSILAFKNRNSIIGDSLSNLKAGGEKKIEIVADEELLVAQCMVLFIAGYETSATTLAFTLFELAKDKNAQRQVQEEIDEYLRRHDNNVNYSVVKELTYSEACVDETLRLYPVLASLTREVVEDYTLPTGLKLEKDMRIHIPVYYLHLNPDFFPEPETFKPERFLPENKRDIKPYTYMPFGEGPRICIGMYNIFFLSFHLSPPQHFC